MKQKSVPVKAPAEEVLKDIRRQTRRHYSAEDKIRIVLEGLRGEESIAELCRREGIAASMYYETCARRGDFVILTLVQRHSKNFMEEGVLVVFDDQTLLSPRLVVTQRLRGFRRSSYCK